jgi:hypothetical protein
VFHPAVSVPLKPTILNVKHPIGAKQLHFGFLFIYFGEVIAATFSGSVDLPQKFNLAPN